MGQGDTEEAQAAANLDAVAVLWSMAAGETCMRPGDLLLLFLMIANNALGESTVAGRLGETPCCTACSPCILGAWRWQQLLQII